MNTNISTKYWMNIVDTVAKASTCRVKIGAIIVQKNIMVGVGFVGSISGDNHCTDSTCLYVHNKGLFGSGNSNSCIRTVHAEMNAVLKCTKRIYEPEWLSCYSTYKPCLNCLKALLSIGVRTIIYKKDYIDKWRDLYIESLHIDIKQQLKIINYSDELLEW